MWSETKRARWLCTAILWAVVVPGCYRSDPGLDQLYVDRVKAAVEGIVPADEKISWWFIDERARFDGRIKTEGRFWARLARDQVALAHRVIASLDLNTGEVQNLTIDGTPYQRDQTATRWWDGIEEYNAEEKFTHLTERQKNELWWEINRRVLRTRGEASTTITWSMDDVVQLTARYNVNPREISEFYEYGHVADWRTEQSPAATKGANQNDPGN